MKTIKVKLDNKTIEVSKLPIGKYAELLKALKEIPKKISGMESISPEKTLEVLPGLISDSLPEAIHILTIATPMESDELYELGLDEIVRICVAVYDVNNYQEVMAQVKKVMAQPKQLPA